MFAKSFQIQQMQHIQAVPPFGRGGNLQKGCRKDRKCLKVGRNVALFGDISGSSLDPESFAVRFLVKN
jgi:hypothetical protein